MAKPKIHVLLLVLLISLLTSACNNVVVIILSDPTPTPEGTGAAPNTDALTQVIGGDGFSSASPDTSSTPQPVRLQLVRLFSQPKCKECEKERQFLINNKLPYVELDVISDPEARDYFSQYAHGTPLTEIILTDGSTRRVVGPAIGELYPYIFQQ